MKEITIEVQGIETIDAAVANLSSSTDQPKIVIDIFWLYSDYSPSDEDRATCRATLLVKQTPK